MLDRRTKNTLGDGSRRECTYDQFGQLSNAVKLGPSGAANATCLNIRKR